MRSIDRSCACVWIRIQTVADCQTEKVPCCELYHVSMPAFLHQPVWPVLLISRAMSHSKSWPLIFKLTLVYASVAPDKSQIVTWKDDFNRGVVVLLGPCAQPAKGAASPGVDAPLWCQHHGVGASTGRLQTTNPQPVTPHSLQNLQFFCIMLMQHRDACLCSPYAHTSPCMHTFSSGWSHALHIMCAAWDQHVGSTCLLASPYHYRIKAVVPWANQEQFKALPGRQ